MARISKSKPKQTKGPLRPEGLRRSARLREKTQNRTSNQPGDVPPAKPQPAQPEVNTKPDFFVHHWVMSQEWPHTSAMGTTMRGAVTRLGVGTVTAKTETLESSLLPRDVRTQNYHIKACYDFLARQGIYLEDDDEDGMSKASEAIVKALLERKAETPSGTVFDNTS
ncbi:hypothetical protein BJX99DRAFT_252953 [Aspergillus californicus]